MMKHNCVATAPDYFRCTQMVAMAAMLFSTAHALTASVANPSSIQRPGALAVRSIRTCAASPAVFNRLLNQGQLFSHRQQSSAEGGRRRRTGVVAMASSAGGAETKVEKSEDEWQAILSPEQFRILRRKGTEYPGTGEYNKHYDDGVYECAGCGTPLYKSTTKFDSGCGWPAFFEGLPGAITETQDPDGRRVEITCTACGGHMGHVFKGEGFKTPTDARHCVNSVSLKFTPANKS